jgi:hypothetical protein
MAAPLYIAEASRVNGVTTLKVVGHGLTAADQGRMINVMGAGHSSLNGRFTIARIVVPDMLQYNQTDQGALPGFSGGAVSIG